MSGWCLVSFADDVRFPYEQMSNKVKVEHLPAIYIYTWNPNDPCFDWKFGLVLGGWVPSKIKVIKGFQVYIYIE